MGFRVFGLRVHGFLWFRALGSGSRGLGFRVFGFRVQVCKKTQSFAVLGLACSFGTNLDLCMSSLRRGHANPLCIVPTGFRVLGLRVSEFCRA